MSWTFPGHLPEISGNVLECPGTCPGTFPGHVLGLSRTCPGNVLEFPQNFLGNFPGRVPEVSRKFLGNFPGHVPEVSRKFLEAVEKRALAPSRRTCRFRTSMRLEPSRPTGNVRFLTPIPRVTHRRHHAAPRRAVCGKNALWTRFRPPGRQTTRNKSRPDAPRVVQTDGHTRPKHHHTASNASTRLTVT